VTSINGTVIDVVKSSTYASNSTIGYSYVSGATVYVGTSSTITDSSGHFTITADPAQPTIVVKAVRFNDTEVLTSSNPVINMWRNIGYT
jgi:hypothetical protein